MNKQTLSDKQNKAIGEPPYYYKEDVKEFIKELKGEFPFCLCVVNEEEQEECTCCRVKRIIDKLAGEQLK